jgi:diguanylate cyclase (GGDEF)-like protein
MMNAAEYCPHPADNRSQSSPERSRKAASSSQRDAVPDTDHKDILRLPAADADKPPVPASILAQADKRPTEVPTVRRVSGHLPVSEAIVSTIDARLHCIEAESRNAACLWFRAGNYGVIEEVYGHSLGMALMKLVESRLGERLRSEDLFARVSTNEFVILLDNADNGDDAARVSDRLLSHCSGIYQTAGLPLHITCSIGIATYPGDATDAHDLLRYARMALREASRPQPNRAHLFTPELLSRLRDRTWMSATLQRAMEDDRLLLHYQPQYTVDTRRVVGVEALVRLTTESGEMVGPDRFIELAEQTGQIVALGRWVMEQACLQLGRWKRAGAEELRMAVNVSPLQLLEIGFADMVDQAVRHAGIEHSDLELEITEGQIVRHIAEVEPTLRKLTAMGVRVAVDDFGTGYSSLAYLMQLSIDVVKVDRAFMLNTPDDPRAVRMVNAIIAMAGELGMALTVEGIETDQQHQFLVESRCPIGQGYHFARPASADAIETYLFRHAAGSERAPD